MKPPVNGSEAAVSSEQPGTTGVRGVSEKTLELLRALASDGVPQRLNALARAANLPKPTAHRLLGSLATQGYASVSSGGLYSPGPLLLGLSAAVLDRAPGLGTIHQCLADLAQRTGQTALFAIPHQDSMVIIDKVDAAQSYRLNLERGQQVPADVTALGRALDHQSTSGGYALEDEDHLEGVWSVAAPVLGPAGIPIGAIAVAGLVFTMQGETAEVFVDLVRGAATAASASASAAHRGTGSDAAGVRRHAG